MYVACMQDDVSASILGEFSPPGGRKKTENIKILSVNSTKFAKFLKYFANFWKPEFFKK